MISLVFPLGFQLDFIFKSLKFLDLSKVDKIYFLFPKESAESSRMKNAISTLKFYLSKIFDENKINFIPIDISSINNFYKEFIRIIRDEKVILCITGGMRVFTLYFLTLHMFGLVNSEKIYIVVEKDENLKEVEIPKINIIDKLDLDDKKVIKFFDANEVVYKTYRELKEMLKVSDTKLNLILRKLQDLNIIEKIQKGEYKLTKLGVLVKLYLEEHERKFKGN